jgi:hypothetical protein
MDNVTPTGWPPRWSASCGSPRYDELLTRIAAATTPSEALDLIDETQAWLEASAGHNTTALKQAAAARALAGRKLAELTAPTPASRGR